MAKEPEEEPNWSRALLVAQIYGMQLAGHLPARSDSKPLEVLLVEAGLSQTQVGALVGRSQQAISLAVNKSKPKNK